MKKWSAFCELIYKFGSLGKIRGYHKGPYKDYSQGDKISTNIVRLIHRALTYSKITMALNNPNNEGKAIRLAEFEVWKAEWVRVVTSLLMGRVCWTALVVVEVLVSITPASVIVVDTRVVVLYLKLTMVVLLDPSREVLVNVMFWASGSTPEGKMWVLSVMVVIKVPFWNPIVEVFVIL